MYCRLQQNVQNNGDGSNSLLRFSDYHLKPPASPRPDISTPPPPRTHTAWNTPQLYTWLMGDVFLSGHHCIPPMTSSHSHSRGQKKKRTENKDDLLANPAAHTLFPAPSKPLTLTVSVGDRDHVPDAPRSSRDVDGQVWPALSFSGATFPSPYL